MHVTLDLIADSATHPAEVLLTGERTKDGNDVLRITLSGPHREIVLNRAELYKALSGLWRFCHEQDGQQPDSASNVAARCVD
jgi:hypothetical protein